MKVGGELLHVVVLLHLQLLLDLHHVNGLRHYVVIIRLVPARDQGRLPSPASSSHSALENFSLSSPSLGRSDEELAQHPALLVFVVSDSVVQLMAHSDLDGMDKTLINSLSPHSLHHLTTDTERKTLQDPRWEYSRSSFSSSRLMMMLMSGPPQNLLHSHCWKEMLPFSFSRPSSTSEAKKKKKLWRKTRELLLILKNE